MRERNAQQLAYYLRRRQSDICYDVASDCESEADGEEIHSEVPDEQSTNEDSDFDPPGRQPIQEENDEEPQPKRKRPGRRRSIVKGKLNFEWFRKAPETRGRHSLKAHLPSAKGQARDVTTPLEVWSLLFPGSMLESIVQHTNEQIERREIDLLQRYSYHGTTDIVELKALLGLMYFTDVKKHNHKNTEGLWSPQFGHDLNRAVMDERTFQYLLACNRFDDKETRNERRIQHRLALIKELWDAFIETCRKYYSPSTHCTIDDQLLWFRGRFIVRS